MSGYTYTTLLPFDLVGIRDAMNFLVRFVIPKEK